MDAVKKITVHVPDMLLRRATHATGQGITTTVRQGLELVAARPAYERLRGLRGKVKLSIDVGELREDRR